MPIIILPFTLTNTETADADEVMADLNTLLAALNGGLEHDNLDAAAAIRLTQLASGALGPAMGAFAVAEPGSFTYPASQTVVKFSVEDHDVSGWFDPALFRYTPQQAGIYHLQVSLKLPTSSSGEYTALKIRKNGAEIRTGAHRAGSTSDGLYNFAQVQANGTTDYFDVVLELGATASKVESCVFEGHLIGLV